MNVTVAGTISTDNGPANVGTLTLNGDVTFIGTQGSPTLNGSVLLAASTPTFNIADGSSAIDFNVPATLSGAHGLIKSGPGTLSLTAANAFTGGVTVAAGTLQIAGDASLNGQSVTLAGGSLLSTGTLSVPILFTGSGSAISVGNANSTTMNSIIGGTAGLTKNGPGTLILGGANTFGGGVTVIGGALAIDTDARLGSTSNSVALSGAALRATSSFMSTRSISLASAGDSIDVAGQQTFTFNGSLTSAFSLTKTGTGTLVLGGTQQWTQPAVYTNAAGATVFNSSPGVNLTVNAASGSVAFGARRRSEVSPRRRRRSMPVAR